MRSARPTLVLMLAALLVAAPAAHATSPDLVISQVFAGGGNAGAAFANDYVEIFNRGSSTVDLSGWTVQYATAAGTSWSAAPLNGAVPPGRRYLVQFASGGTVGLALPPPDATDTTNLSTSGGKVALVHAIAPLTCGASAGSCSSVSTVRDLLGYGSATDFEGAAAPALTNTTAATRAAAGCTDFDANASDFTAEPAAPHNSTSAAATCTATGTSATASQSATVVVTVQSSIALSLERSTVSFGPVAVGDRPPPVSERVTVTSTDTAGYALSVHRSAFAPSDLPLGVSASAPAGGLLSVPFAGGATVALPPTSEVLIGTSASRSATGGDVWPTSLGLSAPVPVAAPGQYSTTIVYTVIGGTIG
jgi:hypothetical protein